VAQRFDCDQIHASRIAQDPALGPGEGDAVDVGRDLE